MTKRLVRERAPERPKLDEALEKARAEIGYMHGYGNDMKPRELSTPERLEEAARSFDYASQEIAQLRRANQLLRTQLDVWDKALNLVNGQMYWTNTNRSGEGMMTHDRVADLDKQAASLRALASKGDK